MDCNNEYNEYNEYNKYSIRGKGEIMSKETNASMINEKVADLILNNSTMAYDDDNRKFEEASTINKSKIQVQLINADVEENNEIQHFNETIIETMIKIYEENDDPSNKIIFEYNNVKNHERKINATINEKITNFKSAVVYYDETINKFNVNKIMMWLFCIKEMQGMEMTKIQKMINKEKLSKLLLKNEMIQQHLVRLSTRWK